MKLDAVQLMPKGGMTLAPHVEAIETRIQRRLILRSELDPLPAQRAAKCTEALDALPRAICRITRFEINASRSKGIYDSEQADGPYRFGILAKIEHEPLVA